MKNIGKALKEKRFEKELSLEQISKDTKISVDKLRAIESGNYDFFEDDFSYIKFYVRYYCQNLGIDFEEYKTDFFASMDEHEKTQSMKAIELTNEMNERVKKRVDASKTTLHHEKRKVDYSILSFFLVVAVLISAGIYVALNYGPLLFSESTDEPLVLVTPTPSVETTVEPTPEIVVNELRVEQNTFSEYYIYDFSDNQEITVQFNFASDTWVQLSIDGVVTNNPSSGTYTTGDSIQLILNATDEKVVFINLGKYLGNEIYINNELLVLDDSVKDKNSGQEIKLVFRGE